MFINHEEIDVAGQIPNILSNNRVSSRSSNQKIQQSADSHSERGRVRQEGADRGVLAGMIPL
jgi:hypothetical protein